MFHVQNTDDRTHGEFIMDYRRMKKLVLNNVCFLLPLNYEMHYLVKCSHYFKI